MKEQDSMAMTVVRILAWGVFLAGLAVTMVGIAGLRVDMSVGGLIGALTSALVLLRLRAQRLGRFDADDARPRSLA
jgi:membrane associated rhomboid family serine protease